MFFFGGGRMGGIPGDRYYVTYWQAQGTYGMLRIEPGSATCKTNTIHAVFWPHLLDF